MSDLIGDWFQSLKDEPPTCFKCEQPIAFDNIRVVTVRIEGEPVEVYCCKQDV